MQQEAVRHSAGHAPGKAWSVSALGTGTGLVPLTPHGHRPPSWRTCSSWDRRHGESTSCPSGPASATHPHSHLHQRALRLEASMGLAWPRQVPGTQGELLCTHERAAYRKFPSEPQTRSDSAPLGRQACTVAVPPSCPFFLPQLAGTEAGGAERHHSAQPGGRSTHQ